MASPDINTEDYSAAVDYFILRGDVDEERIGILGICGWGGIAVNAAVNDTRIKATVTSAMGALDTFNHEQRIAMRKSLNAQRTVDIKSGTFARMGGVPKSVPEDAPLFSKEYTDYYQTLVVTIPVPCRQTKDGTRLHSMHGFQPRRLPTMLTRLKVLY